MLNKMNFFKLTQHLCTPYEAGRVDQLIKTLIWYCDCVGVVVQSTSFNLANVKICEPFYKYQFY